jgi:cysteine desulfurase
MIYLDYAATTPIDPDVAEVIRCTSLDVFGNPSSVHAAGRKARAVLEESRETIAQGIQAEASELIFTSGGTESDNLALCGTYAALTQKNRRQLIICSTEHHAVLESAAFLESLGVEVSRLRVDEYGVVKEEDLRAALRPETFLVSVMQANNEIGTIQDIRSLATIVHERGALFHTDAVQSYGKMEISVRDLGVDLLSMSAHKLYGPKSIGALFVRKGVPLKPILHGGGQEAGRRPGTESAPLAAGFALAADKAHRSRDADMQRITELRTRLASSLLKRFPSLIINGHPEHVLQTILNASFDEAEFELDGDALIMNLDLRGIAVTSGSACTSGSLIPSHVLAAIGRSVSTARATIRFSLGRMTTESEIDQTADIVEEIVCRMQKR